MIDIDSIVWHYKDRHKITKENETLITLKNDRLTVVVHTLGAELQSIRCNQSGREYLWQGNPDIWASRAPVLFPVIGRMKDEIYTVDETTYTIPIHGFAKQSEFQVVSQSDVSVTLSISDTPETQAVYPYAFRFSVTYTLEDGCIHKTHRTENMSDRPLYYEVGGHDGFSVPFHPDETMSDCNLHFPELTCFSPYEFDESVMILPKTQTHHIEDGLLTLTPSTYGLDCIILENLPVSRAEIKDSHGNVRVALDFPDFPYVTLWTKTAPFDTNYICIEPWTSLPDAIFAGRSLSEKIGVRTLDVGTEESLSYDITIY